MLAGGEDLKWRGLNFTKEIPLNEISESSKFRSKTTYGGSDTCVYKIQKNPDPHKDFNCHWCNSPTWHQILKPIRMSVTTFITNTSRYIHNLYIHKVWRKLKDTFVYPPHPTRSHQIKNLKVSKMPYPHKEKKVQYTFTKTINGKSINWTPSEILCISLRGIKVYTWYIIYISFRKNKGPKRDHFSLFHFISFTRTIGGGRERVYD